MTKKMTTGEIAKKAGISQKAIRLYDEKGLLKPSEYSEGNYRLYDKEALFVLEKIIALKQVGFSLEEIKENLICSEDEDILKTLQDQIDMMEAKRYELEKAITRIKAAIVRSNGKPNWDDVADIIRDIQSDQNSDESHFYALKHNADGLDWYVKIYNSLCIKEGARILDLGCGFAKLWRNNWTDIPSKVTIDAYDLHGSWADDFAKFLPEHKNGLSDGTEISLRFEDIEKQETWDDLSQKEPYSMVIAHYLMDVLSDPQELVARAADILAPGGLFSVNNICTSGEDLFWIDAIKASGLNPSFAMDRYQNVKNAEEEFQTVLAKYFRNIENIRLDSPLRFDTPEDLLERARKLFPQADDYLQSNKNKLITYFRTLYTDDNIIILNSDRLFWHCYK